MELSRLGGDSAPLAPVANPLYYLAFPIFYGRIDGTAMRQMPDATDSMSLSGHPYP